jgi:hypothetical protein
MRKLISSLVLCTLVGSVGVAGVKTPAADATMNAFWDKFKAAVIKGDREAVFAMSAVPITMEQGFPGIRTKAQFMKNYKHIFAGEADAARCFKTAKPETDKSRPKYFTISCGFAEDKNGDGGEPLQYTFKLTPAGWRFVGYDNINE